MNRNAFTMIELIFVIVIIGILASIAIPKLAATRDDAKIAARANSITNAATEIAAYAVARGTTNIDIGQVSNSAKTMLQEHIATLQNSGKSLYVKMHTVSDCVKLDIVSDARDVNLTMSYGNAGGDEICKSLQNAVDASRYPLAIGGARIEQ